MTFAGTLAVVIVGCVGFKHRLEDLRDNLEGKIDSLKRV